MVNWFDLSMSVAEELLTLLFITGYLGWKAKIKFKYLKFVGALTVSVMLIEVLNSVFNNEGFLGIGFTIVYFLYAILFLKGDFYTKLFLAQFTNCIAYFTATISIVGIPFVANINNEYIYVQGPVRVIVSIFSKILLALILLILLKFRMKKASYNRYIKVLILLSVLAEMITIGVITSFLGSDTTNSGLVLSTMSVMMANVLSFYVFIKISEDAKREIEIQIMKQKYENDKSFANEIKGLYLKTCGIRHDMINHIEIVTRLIEVDCKQAIEYLNSVRHNQLGQMKLFLRTDNECFDAIANSKIATCDNLGIRVEIRVMNNTLDRLKSDEIGVIIGNLFDNAIEAAKNTQEKRISLDIQKQGKRCSITMMNSIVDSVLLQNSKLDTTKQNRGQHGFGLKNVRRIVESYGGMINFFEEDGMFGCDILV